MTTSLESSDAVNNNGIVVSFDLHLCQRLEADFAHLYESLSERYFDEFNVIHSSIDTNQKPIVTEHVGRVWKLGVQSWCRQPFLPYVKQHLRQLRRQTIGNAAANPHFDLTTACGRDSVKRVSLLTFVWLLFHGDDLSAWNTRRHLLLQKVTHWSVEEILSRLALTANVKSGPAFSQRRWLIRNCYPDTLSVEFLRQELALCTLCSERRFSNYNAFDHRRWVISFCCETLANHSHSQCVPKELCVLLQHELADSGLACERNLLDCSVWSYRQFMLQFCFRLYADGFLQQPLLHEDIFKREQAMLDRLVQLGSVESANFVLHRRFLKHLLRVRAELELNVQQSNLSPTRSEEHVDRVSPCQNGSKRPRVASAGSASQ